MINSEIKFKGQLNEISFPRILIHFYIYKVTGILTIEKDRLIKKIFFKNGNPVYVKSDILAETLGRYLKNSGKISEEDYEKSIEMLLSTKKKYGEILLELKLISPHMLYIYLQEHVMSKILGIFSWAHGNYQIETGNEFKDNITTFEMDMMNILMNGLKTYYTVDKLKKEFEQYINIPLIKSNNYDNIIKDLKLPAIYLKIQGLIDGKRNIDQIILESKLIDEEVLRILYLLIFSGAVITNFDKEKKNLKEISQIERLKEIIKEKYRKIKDEDYFQVLEIDKTATKDQIKNSYFRLAKELHPDKLYGTDADKELKHMADEVFAKISKAYDILSHDAERKKYEGSLNIGKTEEEIERERRNILSAELEFQKGNASLKKNQYDEAINHIKRAIDLQPREGEYYVLLGWANFLKSPNERKNVYASKEWIKKGLDINPQQDRGYFLLAKIYSQDNKIKEAIECFEKAIQINPNFIDAKRELRLIKYKAEKGLFKKILR